MRRIFIVVSILLAIPAFSTTAIVIRHGQSLSNTHDINSGSPAESIKYPLTELGKKQVADAAKMLKEKHPDLVKNIRWVYASPLKRTQETAEILRKGLGISHDKM